MRQLHFDLFRIVFRSLNTNTLTLFPDHPLRRVCCMLPFLLSLITLLLLKSIAEVNAMSSKVGRVAVAQLRSSASKADNLVAIAKCAGWSRREGAAMLFLPECFGFIGQSAKETIAAAEPPLEEDTRTNPAAFQNYLEHMVDSCQKGGDTPMSLPQDSNDISLVDGLRTIARKSNLWISAGGMHVSGAPPSIYEPSKSRVFNTHVILDSSGEIKSTYRKIHLFDVSIPGKVSLQESATTAPGSELVVCDSPIGKLKATEAPSS